MEEIVSYFESPVSGVSGVTQMKSGWDELTRGLVSNAHFTAKDQLVQNAVLSWQQQERNMTLMLSQKIGVLVKAGNVKYKDDLAKRFFEDSKQLVSDKTLFSNLKIINAVSDISIKAYFERKSVEMSVKLIIPADKTIKGQIGWVKRQILNCEKKMSNSKLSETVSEIINKQIFIDINIKFAKQDIRVPYSQLDNIVDDIKNKEINHFSVVMTKDFKGAFVAPKKFVTTLDTMLLNYYRGFVEHLVNWNKPSPKIVENTFYSDIDYYIEHTDD